MRYLFFYYFNSLMQRFSIDKIRFSNLTVNFECVNLCLSNVSMFEINRKGDYDENHGCTGDYGYDS